MPASLVAVTALALAAGPDATARSACRSAHAQPPAATKRAVVDATLCLLNQRRAQHGLGRLRLSRALSLAARRHADDMARHDYFAHGSLGGASFLDRIRRTGYLRGARTWLVGENLAWGSGRGAAPSSVVDAWMRSPGHRLNILTRSFRDIGIGVAFGAPVPTEDGPALTYVTDFATRG
ncbi:MAG: CAP domain-containing protein [Nocardioidaceae bacterium]